MYNSHKLIIKTLVFLLFTILVFSCKSKSNQKESGASETLSSSDITLTPEQWKEAGIVVAGLTSEPMKQTLILSGNVVAGPNQTNTVSSPIQGLVKKILVRPGQNVHAGQAIMVLEDRECIQWQENYLAAKTAFEFARKDFIRQKELNDKKASSDKVLEAAEEKMLQLEIERHGWEEKLKLISISPASLRPENISSSITFRAGSSGMITNINVNPGKYISPGTELATIVSSSRPYVVLKAFEKDLYFLKPEMPLTINSNHTPDKKWTGKIDNIIHQIREEGFAEVYAVFTQDIKDLFPGNYVNATIQLSSVDTQVVPESALVSLGNKDYLFMQSKERTYIMVEVEKGEKNEGKIAVKVPENNSTYPVVVKGAYTLLMALQNVEE